MEQKDATPGNIGASAASSTDESDPPSHSFSSREIERLRKYRAAVNVGFYTDECEPTRTTQLGV